MQLYIVFAVSGTFFFFFWNLESSLNLVAMAGSH